MGRDNVGEKTTRMAQEHSRGICGRHHEAGQTAAPPAHRCTCRSVRMPRRIHAASGALFGLFLTVHLCVNSTAWQPSLFASLTDAIHTVIDGLPGITLIFVFMPLLMQIGTGSYLVYKGGLRYRTGGCNRGSTPRFFLQRLTGTVILCFVTLHLGTLHGWGFHPVHRVADGLTGYAAAERFPDFFGLGSAVYLIGVWAMVFHLANGAVTGAHVLGLIGTDRGKRNWRRLWTIAGLAGLIVGTIAWANSWRV